MRSLWPRRSNWRWLYLVALVVALDQLSKYLVSHGLHLYQSKWLLPWLNLSYLHNTGAAFSMFRQAPAALFVAFAALVSMGILIWLWRHPRGAVLQAAGFCLIMSGAIGNAIDRLWHGYVIDFVDFHVGGWHFAAFNLADSAITIGAALLLLEALVDYLRHATDRSDRR